MLDKDLKATADDLLNTNKLFKEKILDPHYVKKIRDNYNKGKLFYARQMWTLINFELWYRMFIKRQKIKL